MMGSKPRSASSECHESYGKGIQFEVEAALREEGRNG